VFKRVSKHVPIDLMVLAPRSNSVRDEVYLGNTSGKLLKGTDISIFIVPEGSKFEPPKSIMMAFMNGNFERKKCRNRLVSLLITLTSNYTCFMCIHPKQRMK
jgi:hypothetical protein